MLEPDLQAELAPRNDYEQHVDPEAKLAAGQGRPALTKTVEPKGFLSRKQVKRLQKVLEQK